MQGPNFNALMDPMQLGQSITNAFMVGRQVREQEAERDRQIREAEQKQRTEEHQADVRRRAAAGDQGAMAELPGFDIAAFNTLDDNLRERTKQRVNYIGNAALAISQMDPAQRAGAWDEAIDFGVQQGFSDLAQYRGHYSEQALQGVLAQAGMIKEQLGLQEPKWLSIPPGGTVVNTRDPAAVAQYGGQPPPPQQGGLEIPFEAVQQYAQTNPGGVAEMIRSNAFVVKVQTPDQARQLPPGTPILLPDGSQGVVPGGAGSGQRGFP